MRWRACRHLRSTPSVKLQKVIEATKQTFAAIAALGPSDVGNAQEADFKSKMQCFGAVVSGYRDKGGLEQLASLTDD